MNRRAFPISTGFLCLCAVFSGGCNRAPLLDPKGPIGAAERGVIIEAFALMLIVVLPVFAMAFWFAWKYRASNAKAVHDPKWSRSSAIETIVWLVPAVIVAALAVLIHSATHKLDPYKPIDAAIPPVNIQVVSLDWKWLFIYPDQNVAAVSQMVFPVDVPVSFRITSDTVMTSFFIPRLGSQIYAMAGMQTQLHLLAHEAGVYRGQNQQFSGRGYSDMTFQAVAVSREEFEAWVQEAKRSPERLDFARYEGLAAPSERGPAVCFSSVQPGLFEHVLTKYMPEGAMHGAMSMGPGPTHTTTTHPSEGN